MTAVHFAQENVGWSRNVVITFDLVSEDGGNFGAAIAEDARRRKASNETPLSRDGT